MTYFCLVYCGSTRFESNTGKELDATHSESRRYIEELVASGQLRAAASFAPREVITVRARAGTVRTSEGPCMESGEQLGSFFIIEARDMNDAVRIASKHPAVLPGEVQGGAVEVRPIERFYEG